MKEVFLDNNHTKSDIARSLLEKHWLMSTSSRPIEKPHTVHTLLGNSSMQGSGFGYPGVSRAIYSSEKEKTE